MEREDKFKNECCSRSVSEGAEDEDFGIDSEDYKLASQHPYQSREEWAQKNLWWDQDVRKYEIPDTAYDVFQGTTLAKVNHTALARAFPFLEKRGSELSFGLWLTPAWLEAMPSFSSFRKAVERLLSKRVYDDEAWEAAQYDIEEEAWTGKYRDEVLTKMVDKFHGQFGDYHRTLKDLDKFSRTDTFLRLFNHVASQADVNWDLDNSKEGATIDVDAVVKAFDWPMLKRAIYPELSQGSFVFDVDPQTKFGGMGMAESLIAQLIE